MQNGEAEAESVAMVIGAEGGAATGPIPAEARRQMGLRLERPGASPLGALPSGAVGCVPPM